LNFQSASNCIDRAGKLNQYAITGRLNDASMMLGNFRIDDVATVRF
jgi:hypothetical protein